MGLISMADDAGRLVDNVKSIDGFIFPETEDTVDWESSRGCREYFGMLPRAASGSSRSSTGTVIRRSRSSRWLAKDHCQTLARILARCSRYDQYDQYQYPDPDLVELRSTPSLSLVRGNDQSLTAIQARLAAFLGAAAEDGRRRVRVDEWRKVAASLVFAYWAAKTGHTKALLDPKREGVLVRCLRLNGDNVHELLYVVDGALKDDWTMGRDPGAPSGTTRSRRSTRTGSTSRSSPAPARGTSKASRTLWPSNTWEIRRSHEQAHQDQ
jgi:hypothetical protein